MSYTQRAYSPSTGLLQRHALGQPCSSGATMLAFAISTSHESYSVDRGRGLREFVRASAQRGRKCGGIVVSREASETKSRRQSCHLWPDCVIASRQPFLIGEIKEIVRARKWLIINDRFGRTNVNICKACISSSRKIVRNVHYETISLSE